MSNEPDKITREELNESINEFLRSGGKITQFKEKRKTMTRVQQFWTCENKKLESFQSKRKSS